MSWQSYVIPVVISSVLMIACWSVGHFHFSPLWIVVFVALYVLKTHAWIRREQKRQRLRASILNERDAIIAQFGGDVDSLPAWVQFPDTERIEWVNKILKQLWPYIAEYAKQFTYEFVEPQIKAQLPRALKSFKFVEVDCGDMPCRVGGLKVYTENVGRDKIIVDMDVVYAGDAQFTIGVCGLRGGINNVVLSGKVRCVLQPLLARPPMVGGVSGAFVEMPRFDFNLTGMGEFVQLPGLIDAIRSVVIAQTANLCVLPNQIVVPLAPEIDVTKLYFPEPDGVIRLKITAARNLENKDYSLLTSRDKSDPYCEISVGSQVFKTKTIKNDLNPVFNECFEAVVDQASGQLLRVELFDEDIASADEELGRLSIPLDHVRDAGEIDDWYPLEGCKHGDLCLQVNWLDLSTDLAEMRRDIWEGAWLQSNTPLHPSLLMVFVDGAKDLPYPKHNVEPSPFVELTLGRVTQRTPVKPKTTNPLFCSKFFFFVSRPENQKLTIKAVDDGTRRELGQLTIALSDVMGQPDMEVFQQVYPLVHGPHTGRITITTRLRTFVPSPQILSFGQRTNDFVGTHIERSEKSRFANDQKTASQKKKNPDNIAVNEIAASTEPGKTVTNNNGGGLGPLTPEIQLNADNFPSIKRRDSSTPSAATSSSEAPSAATAKSKRDGMFNRLRKQVGGARINRELSVDAPRGDLQIGVRHDAEHNKLHVCIEAARNLPSLDGGRVDSYVNVKMVALDATLKSKGKHHTESVRNNANPVYDADLEFDVYHAELPHYKLLFLVKDAAGLGMLSKPRILGQAELSLADFDAFDGRWLALEPPLAKHLTTTGYKVK